MQRIIHITDLHFWRVVRNPLQLLNKRLLGNLNLVLRRRRYVRLELADAFVGMLREMKADALFVGGDLTTTATEAEYGMAASFLEALSSNGLSVYLVPGNHDFYTFESVRNRRFEKHLGDWLADPYTPVLSRLSDNTPLLRIPTAGPNIFSSRGHITEAQLAQTSALLEQVDETPLLVLAHYPLLPNPGVYPSGIMRRLDKAGALRRLLGESGIPLLYLSGHVHVFSHQRDPLYTNIEQVTTSALFYRKRRHPGGFTEIQLRGTGVSIFPWTNEGDWTRKASSRP